MKLLHGIMPNLVKCHDKALKNGHFLHEAPEDDSVVLKLPSELQLFLGGKNTLFILFNFLIQGIFYYFVFLHLTFIWKTSSNVTVHGN